MVATEDSNSGMVASVDLSWASARAAVQLGAAAGLQANLGQLPGLILVVSVANGHRKLLLQAAQHEVVSGHFRRHRDLYITHARGTRLLFSACRLDSAPHPAEEIQLPEGIEADIGIIESAIFADDGRQLVATFASLGVAASGRHGREQIEAGESPGGPRGFEVGAGAFQVLVLLQCSRRRVDPASGR